MEKKKEGRWEERKEGTNIGERKIKEMRKPSEEEKEKHERKL